jgi:ribosomal protein S12 methylthiotransferase accessory factor YcaO
MVPTPVPVSIKSCLKGFQGYKVCGPEATVERIREGFRRLGLEAVLTFAAPPSTPSIGTFYNSEAYLVSPENPRQALMVRTGKGASPALAAASAAAELVERFSAMVDCPGTKGLGDLWTRRAHVAETDSAEDVLFAQATREFSTDGDDPAYRYCTSLATGRRAVYPARLLAVWHRSHGLAAGNALEEAILQGSAEIVERSTQRVVLGRRLRLPRLDPRSFDDPLLVSLHDAVQRTGVAIRYFDWSLWGVPVVGALFQHEDDLDVQHPHLTVGVSTRPSTAVLRCLAEYLQCRSPALGPVDRTESLMVAAAGLPPISPQRCLRALPYFGIRHSWDEGVFEGDGQLVSLKTLPDLFDRDLAVEIQSVTAALARHGIEVFADDLTVGALSFPVVRLLARCTDPSLRDLLEPALLFNNPLDRRPAADQIRDASHWHQSERWLRRELTRTDLSREHARRAADVLEQCVRAGYFAPRSRLFESDVTAYQLLGTLWMLAGDAERAFGFSEALLLEDRMNPALVLDRIRLERARGAHEAARSWEWLLRELIPAPSGGALDADLVCHPLASAPLSRFGDCQHPCARDRGPETCGSCLFQSASPAVWLES